MIWLFSEILKFYSEKSDGIHKNAEIGARIYRIWVRKFKSTQIITCANLTSIKVFDTWIVFTDKTNSMKHTYVHKHAHRQANIQVDEQTNTYSSTHPKTHPNKHKHKFIICSHTSYTTCVPGKIVKTYDSISLGRLIKLRQWL